MKFFLNIEDIMAEDEKQKEEETCNLFSLSIRDEYRRRQFHRHTR
jgi:hypothetical protein